MKEKVQHLKKELIANAQEKNGVKVIVFKGNANVEVIKDLAFQIKVKHRWTEKYSSLEVSKMEPSVL